MAPDSHIVAWLRGVDFEGILRSPDREFAYPFDRDFGKMMIRTVSHLLGGDACGRYGYTDSLEITVLLDRRRVAESWQDASALQCYLVGLASSKMTLELEAEALFGCSLYAFPRAELAVAYLGWRQQEAALQALERYCRHALARAGQNPATVDAILDGLKPAEMEDLLRQYQVVYRELPSWQRFGTGVWLGDDQRVAVETDLPREADYAPFLMHFFG